MASKNSFTKDEMNLINKRARELTQPAWDYCRNLMLGPALKLKRANGGELTEEALRRITAGFDVTIKLVDDEDEAIF